MNEILIVPDIHGRDFWKPALDYKETIISLGQGGFTEKATK
jgi:hypothetical protein